MRVFLDSAIVIYAVEQVPLYAASVDARLARPGVSAVTSELTLLECRVKPLREGNEALLGDFDDYFSEAIEELIPLSRELIDLATGIRARYGFKTPDALQLAAAVWSGCEIFFTNDHRLDRFSEVAVEVLEVA